MSNQQNHLKGFLIKIGVVISTIVICYVFFGEYITLQSIQDNQDYLRQISDDHLVLSSLGFISVYVILTSLSLPVVALFTLLAGFLFSFWYGMCMVAISFFLHCYVMVKLVRLMFKPYIEKAYGESLKKVTQKIEKKGWYTIIFLRLSMMCPSFVVNCAVAFTHFPAFKFSWVSYICSIPIFSMLVYSGELIGNIESIWELFSVTNAVILICLAIFSFLLLILGKERKGVA